MKPATEYVEKIEALKHHLINDEGFTAEELAENLTVTKWDSFEVYNREYAVFTDEEANYVTRSQILDSLWAFNSSFILEHTEFYKHSTAEEDDAFEDAFRELGCRLYEGANSIIKALIVDMDGFVHDAIQADGRGHFISTYDGEEIESTDGKYFIYRIN